MISEGFKLCYCMFTSNDIRRFQAVLLYVHIKLYQNVSSCVIVSSHPIISEGFNVCYCIFTSNNFFSTTLFLNLSMFQFLSTYGINIKLGYTYVDDMLKFSRKSKTGNMLS